MCFWKGLSSGALLSVLMRTALTFHNEQVCIYTHIMSYHHSTVQRETFAKTPLEAPEDIFTVSYFCDKTLHSAVPTGLLKILAGFIFAVVGSSAKTAKVCTVQKFPAIRYDAMLGNTTRR